MALTTTVCCFALQEDYLIQKQIGKGAYGTAHIVQHKVGVLVGPLCGFPFSLALPSMPLHEGPTRAHRHAEGNRAIHTTAYAQVTGERFVLKKVRLARQTAQERQASINELHLISNLLHRNIIRVRNRKQLFLSSLFPLFSASAPSPLPALLPCAAAVS